MIVTGGVATPGAAGLGDEPRGVGVVVAEHAGDDWGWGLQHELAEGGGAAGLDGVPMLALESAVIALAGRWYLQYGLSWSHPARTRPECPTTAGPRHLVAGLRVRSDASSHL